MNKTKIEWCDYTWNPITGCKNNCWYCYARKMAVNDYYKKGFPNKFEPSFYRERLEEPLKIKKPSRIFVCSMADLFGDWVYNTWIRSILEVVEHCPQHTFMFLTKNPKRYEKFNFPKNCWLGVTVTGRGDWYNAASLHMLQRDNLKFISIEPILDVIDTSYFWLADWIILGGLTPKPVHKQKWIKDFFDVGKRIDSLCGRVSGSPVFMKNNLNWKGKLRQEYPE